MSDEGQAHRSCATAISAVVSTGSSAGDPHIRVSFHGRDERQLTELTASSRSPASEKALMFASSFFSLKGRSRRLAHCQRMGALFGNPKVLLTV